MAPVALGRSAATAIAIDDSDDDQSAPAAPEATVLVVSSDDDVDSSSVRSVSVQDMSAWGGSDATSRRKRKAPRPAVPVRPRSPAPTVSVPVVSAPAASGDGVDDSVAIVVPPAGSPVVSAGPAASANGGRDDAGAATSRRKKAKEPRPRSPGPSFVSLGSPPAVVSSAANHEATSQQKRTQIRWGEQDELTLLATMAENRRNNGGVLETGSVLLNKLLEDGNILRPDLRAAQLSSKVKHLKEKFIMTVDAKYGGSGNVDGGRNYQSRFQYHNHQLYEKSKEVWPELLAAAQERSRDNGGATTSSQQPSNQFI